MIVRSCVPRRTATARTCLFPDYCSVRRRAFHHTPPSLAELPNHYATLDIPPNASAKEIKKQFYKLSKSHHPDLHPNDPAASQKFVRISEAYATLGSPDKRARYDRDIGAQQQQQQQQSHQTSDGSSPRGSYSSSSGPGGRPASGLSRRRTQFRGPPPSFYRSGGWGAQGEKRGEAASKASHAHEARGRAQSNPEGGSSYAGTTEQPGTGPGGFAAGFDDDVPHFDRRAHAQTHSEIERTRHRARRKRVLRSEEDAETGDAAGGSSVLFNFVLISGMLGVIYGATKLVVGAGSAAEGKKHSDREG